MYKQELAIDLREPIVVEVSDYRGKLRLDVRHYYTNKEGVKCPGKSGINLPIADAAKLLDGIQAAIGSIA